MNWIIKSPNVFVCGEKHMKKSCTDCKFKLGSGYCIILDDVKNPKNL